MPKQVCCVLPILCLSVLITGSGVTASAAEATSEGARSTVEAPAAPEQAPSCQSRDDCFLALMCR